MKEISIITNYFPPETGAASNRIAKLAVGLKERGFKVSVICPLPNYPKGKIFEDYQGKIHLTEDYKGVEVTRLWVYANNSANKLQRLLSMISFSVSLVLYVLFCKKKVAKTILIQSPPLIIAHTALRIFSAKKRRLILNVSDLWPLAGYELGAIKKGPSYHLLEQIEKYNYLKASFILGQSEEILAHVLSIAPKKEVFLYRNFPEMPLESNTVSVQKTEKPLKIIYAGLLGIAQGIVKLCQNIELKDAELHIYGAGAEKEALEKYLEASAKPVFFHGEVDRSTLLGLLKKYDLAIVPLINSIYGSTPSKIYEMAHNNLPILYFAGGEGESVVNKYNLGFVVPPGNFEQLNHTIENLNVEELSNLKQKLKKTSATHFNIEKQLDKLAEKL